MTAAPPIASGVAWETFRFPERPVRALLDESDGRSEDDEGSDGKQGQGDPVLEPRPVAEDVTWAYVAEAAALHHRRLRKQIKLSALNDTLKVVRLLGALEHRPDHQVDELIDALEAAAWHRYGQDLSAVLAAHAWGAPLLWPSPASEPEDHPHAHPDVSSGPR